MDNDTRHVLALVGEIELYLEQRRAVEHDPAVRIRLARLAGMVEALVSIMAGHEDEPTEEDSP